MAKNNDEEKSKKRAVWLFFLLGGLLAAGVGISTSLLWNQKPLHSNAMTSREGLKQLLEKYVNAGQFNEAFQLLNQALQQNPDDDDLQRQLEYILLEKQKYDQQQAVAAQDGIERDGLVESLLRQNSDLQNRTNDLWKQLDRLRRDQQNQAQQQRADLEKRKKQAEELVQQAQDAMVQNQAQNKLQSKTPDIDEAVAQDVRQKALQALELNSELSSARELLKAAEAALRENETPQQQQQREDTASETEQLHRSLREARKKGDGAKVDKLVEELLAKDAMDSEANTAKAKRIEEQQGDTPQALKEAEQTYRKALASDPKQNEALAGLARNLDKQNRLEEAAAAYDKAVEKPEEAFDKELYYQRGVVLYRLGQYAKAADSFKEYIEIGGENLRTYYALGMSYQRLLRSREAKKAFETAIAKGLQHAATYWELSKLELEQADNNKALKYADEALALKQGDLRYLQTKGAALFSLKRYNEAAAAYKKADQPNLQRWQRGQVNYNMGLSYYNSAQYPQAEMAFDNAVSLDEDKPEYLLGLADAQIASGKQEEAQQTLSSAQKKFPGNTSLLQTQGEIYLKAKEYKKAVEVLQQAYEQDPKNRHVINNLGLAYMYTEQFDQCRTFFRKAIDEDPSNGNLWFNLALVDVATEQHENAIDNLEKTVSLDSKMSEAYYFLAKQYLAANRRDKARDALNRLRRADPKYSKIVELEKLLGS